MGEEYSVRSEIKGTGFKFLRETQAEGDLIEVLKWYKGYKKGDIDKILEVNNQGITRNNGLKLEKFKFKRGIERN